MKKMIRLKSIVLTMICLVLIAGSVFGQGYQDGIMQGVVRIKVKPQITAALSNLKTKSVGGVVSTGIQPLDNINTQLSAVEMKRVFPYSPKHEAKHQKYGLHLWYEVKYTSGVSPLEAVAGYAGIDDIALAEPVLQKQLITGEVKNVPVPSSTGAEPFNDPYLPKQWHYSNTGEQAEVSVAGADINLYKAWEIETGKPNVVVNIVDGGFQTDHEDLAANVWINQAEANGEEGVDDDGNGYVDDINGYNFVDEKGEISSHFHGTHVAGTVAAVTNNGIGVAGVAGGSGNNDGVRIMSSQIFTTEGGHGNNAAAIAYGADNGAVISQNSWGYTSPGYVEQVILDAIDYFIAEAGQFDGSPMKGGIVFFAAGNSGQDAEFYPGYYNKSITVASIGPDGKKAGYSNYGEWVDISAPGGNMDYGTDHGVLSTMEGNKYGYLDGTSMACPHMSGIAALVVSKYGSESFTNEDLKTHILTGTRDVYQDNPDYAGKLGVGYIDTWLALHKDNGIAPNAVTDLSMVGIAQDFATLNWSVPADEDDVEPVAFEVLYSTEEISNENADLADKLSVSSKDTVGAIREVEIPELEPTTTFYFAVRSIDRWGNVSEVSNVISGTTNTGPAIKTDQEEMSFSVDASVATSTRGVFTILNEDEGVLKWEGSTRQKTHSLSYNTALLNYPEAKTALSQKNINQIQIIEEARVERGTLITPMGTPDLMANFYDEFYYGDAYGRPVVIGETDTTFTNSSATHYNVDSEEGFNLTHVEMFLQHMPSTGPMIMEIYQGNEIHKKNLVFAQEVTSNKADYYWHYIQLDEQLYFEKGTDFWIVFHVPAGNLFPLGMIGEADPQYSDNCMMSLDMGKSWMKLEEALGGDSRYVWTTAAISKNQHLGNYISLNPASGTVEGNSSQEVEISLDATTLINGDYSANVVLQSNDGDDRFYRMPVSLNVSGQEPVLVNEKVIDFGAVFHGHNKEITFSIQNTGYGNFVVATCNSTDDQFEIIKKPRKIAARDLVEVTILYTPDGAGNDNGAIELVDKQGRTHTINLFGVAAASSEIMISPAEQQLSDMAVGDTTSTSITITNTGEYPLEYVIPSFAEDVKLEGLGDIHKYGYTLESNVDGDTTAVFKWNDISTEGTEVTDFFKEVLSSHNFLEVDMGFEFPFYGRKLNKINLTRYGLLALDQNGPLGNCRPYDMGKGCSPDGFISAFTQVYDINKCGQIFYSRQPGKFTVQYENVQKQSSWGAPQKATFQIVLYYNGDVELYYKDIEQFDSYTLKGALIGLCDPEHADQFIVNGRKDRSFQKISGRLNANETIFRIKAPGQQLITSVSEPYGIVKVGESKNIDLKLSLEGMYEGNLFQRLAIASNDPFHNPTAFTVKVDVTSGGMAEVSLSKDTVEMGQVFQGGARRDMLVIKNEGTRDVEITSISAASDNFTITAQAPALLKAKSSNFIYVELNTNDKGEKEDVLLVETSDGKSFEVYLHGEVVPAPGITVDVTPISETLEAGEMITKTISIENNGEADLEIVPAGNDWLHLSNTETMANSLKNFTYYAMDSNDEDGPAYSWEEVRGEGTRIDPTWYAENKKFWKPVALPWEFTFYNQPTDTIWISWEGVISVSKPTFEPPFVFPNPIPFEDGIDNIIAPYFTVHNWNFMHPNLEEVGVFYQFFDDRIVVEWAEWFDLYGMGNAYHFEAILYKNGNIKFQYKLGAQSFTSYGVVGVENADGTDAVQLALYQPYIENELAVSLTPAEKQIIPAGQSKQLNVAVDAKYLNKGEYTGNFRIFNNTPQNSEVMLPVSLTVNGEPAIETPDSIEFGQVMAYQIRGDFDIEQKAYMQEFVVKNTGRDNLSFTSIGFEDSSEIKVEIEFIDPFWGDISWREIQAYNLPTIVPGDQAKMRIRLLPTGDNAEINQNLVFVSNLPEGDYSFPVHASVVLPPVLELGQDSVSVMANTPDYLETRTFVVDNTNGLSALDYSLEINFLREGKDENAEATSAEMFVSAPLISPLLTQNVNVNNIKPYADDSYHSVLEYDTLSSPVNAIGFGESLGFISATAFQAPENGFNLTHVKTWYNYGDILSSRISVEIRAGGTSVVDAKVLYREGFNHTADETGGEYLTLKLTENLIFYPGETFYVVFDYPLGVERPQGVVEGMEQVAGRFMYSNGPEWADLQNVKYGWGCMVKALEKEHKSKSWVDIDGEMYGSVPAGESGTINLTFKASDAQDVDNSAEMTISTNDPKTPEAAVALFLHKNQGPQFVLDSELTVSENESLNALIPVQDAEQDVCTYTLAEAYDFVQMTAKNDTITFVYTPDFESAGLNTFTIKGEDLHGNVTSLNIPIEVVNVNRAPELIGTIDAREYYEDEEFDYIDLLPIFSDPDNEVLSYNVTVDNPVVTIFTSEEEMAIRPLVPGEATLTVVASDAEGLSAETSFRVTIGTVTGIEDPEGTLETKVYPVPTSGPLNIVLGNDIEGEVSISILNVTGLTQYQTTVNKMSGEHIERLNISNMPSGIYLVKITSAKGDIVKRVVKM